MSKYLHWLTVGYVSDQAREHIIANGGRVDEIQHDPAFIAVGLPDSDEKYTSWSKGRIQYRDAIEFWNSGEIQMEHMTLEWGPRNAEWHSCHETYLICSFEEWNQAEHRVKTEQDEPITVASTPAGADDFDPFLDSDDLP
jgi:hypothetical protein